MNSEVPVEPVSLRVAQILVEGHGVALDRIDNDVATWEIAVYHSVFLIRR